MRLDLKLDLKDLRLDLRLAPKDSRLAWDLALETCVRHCPKSHLSYLTLFYLPWKHGTYWKAYVVSTVASKLGDFWMSQAVTYTLKVIISRKRCKIETLLLQTTNSMWCMVCWKAPGYCKLFEMVFSYSRTAVDKISTDIARRAVPLRELSLLRNMYWAHIITLHTWTNWTGWCRMA